MTDVLSLHLGAAFKHAFSQPNIFREFVRDVTGVTVNPAQIHTEYEYPEKVGNVNIKYDLFAEDDEQRIIVEIQHLKEEDFFPRFLYYHIVGIMQQVANHDEYEPPKTVYTIVVLASVPQDGSITFSWGEHLMDILDEHSIRHMIAPHRLIFLNPRLVNEKTPTTVRPWLELIKDSFSKEIDEDDYNSPTLKDLIARINRNTMSPEMSAAIKDETAWEKATERFQREGIDIGRRLQQGQTARFMLDQGIDVAIISGATGLTSEEIEAIENVHPQSLPLAL